MNAVVLYYSLDGNTELIAKLIAESTGASVIKIKPVKEFPSKNGFKKFFIGGKSVIFKEKPKLVNENLNFERFDTIIIGTPVWAGGISSPIYSALWNNRFTDKNTYLFACHASSEVGNCFVKLSDLLKGNHIKGTIDFINPKQEDFQQLKQKVEKFCEQIIC